MCVWVSPADLLSAARFTNVYICLVDQKAAPKKCVFLSTSGDVRGDMKNWVVSDAVDKWSVRLDIRDLGGHLDSTLWSWECYTWLSHARRYSSCSCCCCSSLGFFIGRLRILRTMHLLAALHGAEASLVSHFWLTEAQNCFLSCLLVWWSLFG